MFVCMHTFTYVCMYDCMHVCMDLSILSVTCMCVCVCVCVCVQSHRTPASIHKNTLASTEGKRATERRADRHTHTHNHRLQSSSDRSAPSMSRRATCHSCNALGQGIRNLSIFLIEESPTCHGHIALKSIYLSYRRKPDLSRSHCRSTTSRMHRYACTLIK